MTGGGAGVCGDRNQLLGRSTVRLLPVLEAAPAPPRPAPPARAGGSVSVSDTEPSRAQHIYTLNITLHCEQGLYLHLEYGTVEH